MCVCVCVCLYSTYSSFLVINVNIRERLYAHPVNLHTDPSNITVQKICRRGGNRTHQNFHPTSWIGYSHIAR